MRLRELPPVKRFALVTAILTVAFAAVVYVCDLAVFHLRVFSGSAPYGSVTVRVYYAVQEKNNRTEYMYKDTEQQNCVQALFPHSGLNPCWYLKRHAEVTIGI